MKLRTWIAFVAVLLLVAGVAAAAPSLPSNTGSAQVNADQAVTALKTTLKAHVQAGSMTWEDVNRLFHQVKNVQKTFKPVDGLPQTNDRQLRVELDRNVGPVLQGTNLNVQQQTQVKDLTLRWLAAK